MKKISLLVLLCMIFSVMAFTLSSCGNHAHEDADGNEICDTCQNILEHENHNYGTAWSYDATNHYHVCDKCNAKDASAAHADANNDNACDTCGIVMTNNHVFDKAWSSDATNHWHAPLCGHDVAVIDKAAHTTDILGNCTVCGYNVSAPDVSTVEKALAVALFTSGKVTMGEFSFANVYPGMEPYFNVTSFEYGDGFLHTENEDQGVSTYVTKNADGTVCYVSMSNMNGNTVNLAADAKYYNGVEVNLQQFIDLDVTTYGAAELLKYFTETYLENIPDGAEAIVPTTNIDEDGVYGFGYIMPLNEEGTRSRMVQVMFTLDENYVMDQFGIMMGIVGDTSYSVLMYEQACGIENGYGPEDIIPEEITLYNDEHQPIELTDNTAANINAYVGEYRVYIKATEPYTALIEALGEITVAVKDTEGNDVHASSVYAYYNTYGQCVVVDFKAPGTYNVNISVGGTTYVVPFTAAYKAPDSISPLYYVPSYYGFSDYNSSDWGGNNGEPLSAFTGDSLIFSAAVPEGCEPDKFTVSVDNSNATVSAPGVTDNAGYNVKSYTVTFNAAGQYTLTFTSEVDSSVTSQAIVNVQDPPQAKDVAKGKYTGSMMSNGSTYAINFYTQDAVDNSKGVFVVTVTANSETTNAIYTYYIKDNTFVATLYSQDANSPVQDAGIDSSFNVYVNCGMMTRGELTLTFAGETTDAEPAGGLPTAPGAPAAPAGNPPFPSSFGTNQTTVDSNGTQVYDVTIEAGGTFNFSIDNYTLSADYIISVNNGATINYNYNDMNGETEIADAASITRTGTTDYYLYFIVTNTTNASVTVTITITASNVEPIPAY